ILLRAAPYRYSATIRRLMGGAEARGLFKGIDITSGSIGTGMARLWKGEVGAAALTPGTDTPWDMWPIIGISRQLGFIFLRDAGHGRLERFDPAVSTEANDRNFGVLIVHESGLEELTDFMS